MALRDVPPPDGPVYRVTRTGMNPFAPPDWAWAGGPHGTFPGRFDDPGKRDGLPESRCFRTIYCSTERAGAFGESLAHRRVPLATLARIAAIQDDGPLGAVLRPEVITADWRQQRHVGAIALAPRLRFVNVGDAETIEHLRRALAPVTVASGLADFDLSAVAGPHRLLTQRVARYIYEQGDDQGAARYAGIRYLSRLNPLWECWAVYSDRLSGVQSVPGPINPNDPALRTVAALFQLVVL